MRKALDKLKKGYSKEHICKKVFSIKPPAVKYTNNADQFLKDFYNSQFSNKLAGYRSYLISLVKFNDKFGCFHEKEITKYSVIIDEISNALLKP
ncbi:hypothetical protein DB351_18125 [Klebsiella pneumoniae]|nr:hypothetical protein DB351_18125 [Klebsiella pneumoniae]